MWCRCVSADGGHCPKCFQLNIIILCYSRFPATEKCFCVGFVWFRFGADAGRHCPMCFQLNNLNLSYSRFHATGKKFLERIEFGFA